MAAKVKQYQSAALRDRAPAISIEDRENQLISMAVATAERRMRDGTAPTAMVLHYLKLGSLKEKKELKKLDAEIALLESKKNVYDSMPRLEALYAGAIEAMTTYGSSINQEDGGEDAAEG